MPVAHRLNGGRFGDDRRTTTFVPGDSVKEIGAAIVVAGDFAKEIAVAIVVAGDSAMEFRAVFMACAI